MSQETCMGDPSQTNNRTDTQKKYAAIPFFKKHPRIFQVYPQPVDSSSQPRLACYRLPVPSENHLATNFKALHGGWAAATAAEGARRAAGRPTPGLGAAGCWRCAGDALAGRWGTWSRLPCGAACSHRGPAGTGCAGRQARRGQRQA
jgi:hypothetical protein